VERERRGQIFPGSKYFCIPGPRHKVPTLDLEGETQIQLPAQKRVTGNDGGDTQKGFPGDCREIFSRLRGRGGGGQQVALVVRVPAAKRGRGTFQGDRKNAKQGKKKNKARHKPRGAEYKKKRTLCPILRKLTHMCNNMTWGRGCGKSPILPRLGSATQGGGKKGGVKHGKKKEKKNALKTGTRSLSGIGGGR